MNTATGKQEPEGKPDNQHDPKKPEKSVGGKGISRVSLGILCVAISCMIYAWGGLYGNLGPSYWIFAALLMIVGTTVLAFGLRIELRNHHWIKQRYDCVFWFVVLTGLGLGGFLIAKVLLHVEPKSIQEDFIPGTQVTHRQLDAIFPYGYRVIFKRDGTLQRDPEQYGAVEWDIDWANTRITPDYSSRKVTWFVGFANNRAHPTAFVHGMTVVTTAELTVGVAYPLATVRRKNEPEPFGMVLSDDQRSPVFVVGFRILDH